MKKTLWVGLGLLAIGCEPSLGQRAADQNEAAVDATCLCWEELGETSQEECVDNREADVTAADIACFDEAVASVDGGPEYTECLLGVLSESVQCQQSADCDVEDLGECSDMALEGLVGCGEQPEGLDEALEECATEDPPTDP